MSFLTIGSFNIRNFSQNSSKKDVDTIAKIIKSENFDIIAMQEIIDESSARAVCSALGSGWSCFQQRPPVASHVAKGYAFLWRHKAVEPYGDAPFAIWPDTSHVMTRPPCVGTFTYRGKHIALINVQLAADDEFSVTKQTEYKHLCTEIFPSVDRKSRIEHLSSHSILLGDYNLRWERMAQLHSMVKTPLLAAQDQPTTLTAPNADAAPEYYWSLDHFTFDSERTGPHVSSVSRIDAPMKYTNGDFKRYREQVSDHVPIKMELSFY